MSNDIVRDWFEKCANSLAAYDFKWEINTYFETLGHSRTRKTYLEKVDEYREKPEMAYKENEPIQNFLRYKALGSYKIPFDCDNSTQKCKLTSEVNRKLWYGIYDPYNDKASGDTIFSFWMIFCWCVSTCCKDYEFKHKCANKDGKPVSPEGLLDKYSEIKEAICTKSEDLFKALENFARLTHTIGNFTLVPKRIGEATKYPKQTFNQFKGSGYDLIHIALRKVSDETSSDSRYREWKAWFEDERETLFLDELFESLYSAELCKGEVLIESGGSTDEDINDMRDYLKCVNGLIKRRGKLMEARLPLY